MPKTNGNHGGKRRTRSPHPGVYLQARVLPGGRKTFRARYVDPDTGRLVYESLDMTALSTKEARRDWAMRKSQVLAVRRMDIAAGGSKRTTTDVSQAQDDFFKACKSRLSSKTTERYRTGIERFTDWAGRHGVKHVEELTPARLKAFHSFLVSGGRYVVVKGGERGERAAADVGRKPVTINTDLTSVKVLLNHWRALGLVPQLSRDSITDSLKRLTLLREQPEYLSPQQLRQLFESVARYDADTYKETRAEHRGEGEPGSTLRYAPIAPYTALVLLSGCRRGEALGLRWLDIDLDALDRDGERVGEIRLRAEVTKTKHARTIGLEVSPALRRVLAALKLRSGNVPYVFGGDTPYTADLVESARSRLIADYGAPLFSWQLLRSTASTYLACSSIFGGATLFMAAKQLGHSVQVAERHYAGTIRGIHRDVRTLEDAMQIRELVDEVASQVAISDAVNSTRYREAG